MPLPAQLHALLWRHLAEAPKIIAHPLLLFRRQALELLPALAQNLALLRRYLAPLLEALLRTGPLLGCHRQPALAAARQRLLTIRWQGVPLILVILQKVLLLR